MPSFTVDTNPRNFVFLVECEVCGWDNSDAMGSRGPIAAYRQALNHARACLDSIRTREGTNEWPADYCEFTFMDEQMTVDPRGPAYAQH